MRQHRQIRETAFEPAGCRQPDRRALNGLGVEHVLQALRGAQRRTNLRSADLLTNIRRVDQRDGALNRAVGFLHHLAQTRQGIALGARVILPLRLDHDGPAGRLLNQHIGTPGAALQGALVLGQDRPAGRAELL